MDTVTQMILGAAVGQAAGYKKIGKTAIILGVIGGTIPDLDVFYTPLLGELGEWKYHRHVTHSLFFGPLFGTIMGWAVWKWRDKIPENLSAYIAVCVLAILTHPLLDLFTIYGTQLLAPFSTARFEISAVSIIDPVYTLILTLGLLTLCFKNLRRRATMIGSIALALSTLYLGYGWTQNLKAEKIAIAQLNEQGVAFNDINTYTTLFQPYLRRIVVREPDNNIRVGFVSTWSPQDIKWSCRTLPDDVLTRAAYDTEEGKTLLWFANNEVTAQYSADGKTLSLLDARYGLTGDTAFGWWGLTFPVTDKILAPPEKYRGTRDASSDAIANLFRAAYGRPNTLLPEKDIGCPAPKTRQN